VKADAEGEGAVEQKLMKGGAAYASAGACGEDGFGDGSGLFVEEADAAEEMAFGFAKIAIEVEPKVGERAHGVGHEAFAAGLVDGGLHGVDDFDVEAFVCGGDGGSEACGTCAYD
jgi:hypothetical protein